MITATKTKGRPRGHRGSYVHVQKDARKILKRLGNDVTLPVIVAEYGCSTNTIRRAVVSIIGIKAWRTVVKPGHRKGSSIKREKDHEAQYAQSLEDFRNADTLWECVGCAWDTKELVEFCPKCLGTRFELIKRSTGATAFHQAQKKGPHVVQEPRSWSGG